MKDKTCINCKYLGIKDFIYGYCKLSQEPIDPDDTYYKFEEKNS